MTRTLMLALLLALAPQAALARVYMCVDPATGEATFTDKACTTGEARGEEVRVDRANLHSGKTYGRQGKAKTWSSEQDTRKTGLDYNQERRDLYVSRSSGAPD